MTLFALEEDRMSHLGGGGRGALRGVHFDLCFFQDEFG